VIFLWFLPVFPLLCRSTFCCWFVLCLLCAQPVVTWFSSVCVVCRKRTRRRSRSTLRTCRRKRKTWDRCLLCEWKRRSRSWRKLKKRWEKRVKCTEHYAVCNPYVYTGTCGRFVTFADSVLRSWSMQLFRVFFCFDYFITNLATMSLSE